MVTHKNKFTDITSARDGIAEKSPVAQVNWEGTQEDLKEQVDQRNARARTEKKRRVSAETDLATKGFFKEAAIDHLKVEIAEKQLAVEELNAA